MASIALVDGIIDVGEIEVNRTMGRTHIAVGDGEISMTNEEWQAFREKIL